MKVTKELFRRVTVLTEEEGAVTVKIRTGSHGQTLCRLDNEPRKAALCVWSYDERRNPTDEEVAKRHVETLGLHVKK